MKKVTLYILISAFLFATMEVALKVAGADLDAFQTTFLRFFFGGLVLLPFGLSEFKKNKANIKAVDFLYMLLLGSIGIPISMVLFQLGIMHSNASTAAVLFSVNPLFTSFFAHFLTKNDKLTKLKVISLCIALVGIAFMVRPWDIQPGNTFLGAGLLIMAAAFFGLYTVLGGKTVNRIGTYAQTSISFLLGSLVLFIILVLFDKPIIAGISDNILLLAYLSIFITGFGYFFYFLAIRHSNATTGSIVFFVKPVIAPIIAVIVLSEQITWNMYIGIILILLGSYIPLRNKLKKTKKEKVG